MTEKWQAKGSYNNKMWSLVRPSREAAELAVLGILESSIHRHVTETPVEYDELAIKQWLQQKGLDFDWEIKQV